VGKNLTVTMFLGGWATRRARSISRASTSPWPLCYHDDEPGSPWSIVFYADALAVHDDPFDYTLRGKCGYRSGFHYSS
jgi:hypothetical protein